jgi:hypothetical protein
MPGGAIADPGSIAFQGGFLYGVVSTAGEVVIGGYLDLIQLIAGFLSRGTDVLSELFTEIENSFGNGLKRLGGFSGLAPYDQGKLLGILLASAIGLILAGKGIITAARKAPQALERAGKATQKALDKLRNLIRELPSKVRGLRNRKDVEQRAWKAILKAYRSSRRVVTVTLDGQRKLPNVDSPWRKYQQHVTGRDYEEIWYVDGKPVYLDARISDVIVEVKWTGRNEEAWKASFYNPASRFYSEENIVQQAASFLEIDAATRGGGVRYAVSNEAGRAHFEAVLRKYFPGPVAAGRLRIIHVSGVGMSLPRGP